MSNPPPRPVHLSELVRYVADKRGLHAKDILGPRRWPVLVEARREIAAALFDAWWGYPDIARALHRDRTTVMYYLGAAKGNRERAA